MNKVFKALNLAQFAHKNQVDKSGNEYILHPISVAAAMSKEEEIIVALLHDTIEDSDVTLDSIREMFGETIAQAIDSLTHREGEDYFDYIARIKTNPLAQKVKLSDLANNMNLSRLDSVTEKDLNRVKKYIKAYKFLLDIED